MVFKRFFILILFAFSVVSIVTSTNCFADWVTESKKVDYLLSEIEKSEAKFIRNGTEYDAKSAVQHLRMKLEKSQASWFAPAKDKWTAEMFIEKIATKSSMSGEPYLIKEKDKASVPARDWLLQKLNVQP